MKKYDIPTLLAMRHNACIDVEKFSSQALGNNLFRRRKANTSTSNLSRSRNTSNFSCRSETGSSTTGGSQRLPYRQPSNPPEGAPAQTDTGFARFLKEHASPKHQRVTAGGRIVPMDPVTPAPKMKLPAPAKKQDMNSNNANASKAPMQSESSEADNNPFRVPEESTRNGVGLDAPSILAGLAGDPAKPPPGYTDFGSQLQAPGLVTNFPPLSIAPSQFLQRNIPMPFDNRQLLQPEQQSQDYMAVVPNYGLPSIATDPLAWMPNFSQPSSSQDPSLISASSSQPHLVGSAIQSDGSASSGLFGMSNQQFFSPALPRSDSLQFITNPLSATNQPLHSGVSQERTRLKSLHDARKEYETLSTQLSRLDRYMALRTWELNSRSKRSLVEQRIDLVRKLDAVRSYKEELESTFAASRPNILHTDRKVSTSAQFSVTDVASNQSMQMPWLPNITNSYAPPVLYPPAFANTFPTLLPINEPLGKSFQCKGKESSYSFDNNQESANTPTDSSYYYGTEQPCHERANAKSRHKTQPLATGLNENRKEPDNRDGWATPKTSAPPNIHKIYQQIEESINRGESVEGPLKELAAITARNARTSNHSSGSPQPAPRRIIKPVPSSNTYDPRKSQSAYADHVRCNTDSDYMHSMSRNIHGDSQPTAHTTKRPWKSEERMRFSSETVDEDDTGTCSSYASTGSWATVQDGENDWFERQPERKGDTGKQAGAVEAPGASTRVNSPNLPSSTGLQNVSNKLERKYEEMEIHKPRKAALSSSPANLAGQTVPNNMKNPGPQFLTQCLNNRRGFVSQKTPAVAVSQNVNAHAFLPPFDGAGDEPDGDQFDQGLEDCHRQADHGVNSSAEPQQAKVLSYVSKK